jgi:hypothetical protein
MPYDDKWWRCRVVHGTPHLKLSRWWTSTNSHLAYYPSHRAEASGLTSIHSLYGGFPTGVTEFTPSGARPMIRLLLIEHGTPGGEPTVPGSAFCCAFVAISITRAFGVTVWMESPIYVARRLEGQMIARTTMASASYSEAVVPVTGQGTLTREV